MEATCATCGTGVGMIIGTYQAEHIKPWTDRALGHIKPYTDSALMEFKLWWNENLAEAVGNRRFNIEPKKEEEPIVREHLATGA